MQPGNGQFGSGGQFRPDTGQGFVNQNGGAYQTPTPTPPTFTNPQPANPKPPSTITIGQAHGSAGAGYFWVAPGGTAYIFDLDAQKFYVKTVDEVGRPYPLETYEYTKVIEEPPRPIDSSSFVSKEEFGTLQQNVSDMTEALSLMMEKIDNLSNRKPQQQRKEKRNEQSV